MKKLVLPFPPSANHYLKRGKSGVYRTARARSYREEVGWKCLELGLKPMRGDLIVTINVYRPQRRGDLDNCAKVTLDALQGFAYVNDSQIVELHMHRHEDKANPRVEVVVVAAGRGA